MFATAKRRLAAALIAAAAAAAGGTVLSQPSAPVRGVDFGWGSVSAGEAHALGAGFAVSYLDYFTSKDWTRSQLAAYRAERIPIAEVFEAGATEASAGYAAGVRDAASARSEARALGIYRAIYFAVDFDSSLNPGVIVPYFRGVVATLGVAHVGVYGGAATMNVIHQLHLATFFWQTSAWSRGVWVSFADLEQYAYTNSYDFDRAMARDYGQATAPAPTRVPCFGSGGQPKAPSCRATVAKVSSQERASASSEQAYRARGCPTLSQRISWFSGQLRRHPGVRAARRRRALASSRRAFSRQACGVFEQRDVWFAAHAQALAAENT